MVLLRPSFIVQITRKISDRCFKSEVIFRQCSNNVAPVNKQLNKQIEALVNKEETPELKIVPKTTITHVPLTKNIEGNSDQQIETSSFFEINRENFYDDDYLHGFTPKVPKALDTNTEDLSHLGLESYASYNIASFANKSKTVQELTKLGVELWKFDSDLKIMKMIVSLDFERDVKPYIQFLHDTGLPPEQFGNIITKFPKIFTQDLDDLHTRIRYLRAHDYTPNMITTILMKYPEWLSYTTEQIDKKLGYFQHTFKLKASEVRTLTIKLPKLIHYQRMVLEKKTFTFTKMMGFELKEAKFILLDNPRVWTKCMRNLMNTFEFAHNTMGLSHEIISKQSEILSCRKSRLETRHKFLVLLKKAQYNPSKPLYVSPKAIVSGTDSEFCANIAKTTILTYNDFLKTF